jgi:hypothetical protein
MEFYSTSKQLDLEQSLPNDIRISILVVLAIITSCLAVRIKMETLEVKDQDLVEKLKAVKRVEESSKMK